MRPAQQKQLPLSLGILLIFGMLLASQPVHGVCGCTGMTVSNATGSQQIICTSTRHIRFSRECTERTGTLRTECSTTYEYSCPVGVNSQDWQDDGPTQKTGFGITATLTGTASDCTSGQLLALTMIGDIKVAQNPKIRPTNSTGAPGQLVPNVTFNVNNDNTQPFPQYPIGGGQAQQPNFGGDNYRYADDAAVLIERSKGLIRWWDNTDQEKFDQQERASWKYKYVSWVRGSSTAQSSCACSFDLTVDWDSNVPPVTTFTQDPAYSNNCTL